MKNDNICSESEILLVEKPSVHNFLDITGDRYGRLVVIGYAGSHASRNRTYWYCKCDCGTFVKVGRSHIRSGKTKSCGCLFDESVSVGKQTHGHALERNQSKTYHTWSSMKRRCYNKKASNYDRYGGRGIQVCDRWLNSFENFLEDMGEKPDGMTIERLKSNGNYAPENCKWADNIEQANNKSNNRILDFDGKSMTVAQWARELGLSYKTLSLRLLRGWSVEKTLTGQYGKKLKSQK